MAKNTSFISISFTETVRSRLCFVIAVINWLSIIGSLSLLGLGGYIKLAIQEYTNMVKNYDGDTLPYLLVSVGAVSVISNAGGGWLIFQNANPTNRIKYRHFLFAYIIMTLCVCILIMAGGIMCFAHVSHLQESFAGGLTDAIKQYKTTPHLKLEIDLLQMEYNCCANEGYKDWFNISWIKEDYLNLNIPSVKS